MAQLAPQCASSSCTRRRSSVPARVRLALAWLRRAVEVSRQRRALYQLDERALHDLGLSRADAWQEADKPFWEQSAGEAGRRSC